MFPRRSHCAWLCGVLAFTVVAAQAAPVQNADALFDFQSAFWPNLHNYLHALARSGGPLVEPLPESATAADREPSDAAAATERILRDLPRPVAK